jgi:phosphohistidine phosphatase
MSKTVFLMRHGKSDWADPGCPDHDRPLNARGREAVPRIGQWFLKQGLPIDRIVSSTALRARSTATGIASELGYPLGEVVTEKCLYLAEPAAYLRVLSDMAHPHQTILVVGHNPGMSELVSQWTGELVDMPTAAVAQLELATETWHDLAPGTPVRLVQFIRPREL